MVDKTEVTDMESSAPCQIDQAAAGFDAGVGLFGPGGDPVPSRVPFRERARRRLPRSTPDSRAPLLASIVAARIVPRLVLAHRPDGGAASRARRGGAIAPHDVLVLGELVLAGDLAPAEAMLESMVARGVPLEDIYLDLLAPTACRLGELWCDDRLSFVEVTIGQVALQRLQRAFSGMFLRDCPAASPRRRVLLSPLPGEQHGFGHLITCDFFRRAGWQVSGEPFDSNAALVAAVADTWYAAVGLSLSCAGRLGELSALIRAMRSASRNATVAILVGGAPFCDRPSLAWRVGADATAVDARQAPARAEALVGMLEASA